MDSYSHSLFLCRLDYTKQDVRLNCTLVGFIQDHHRVPESHKNVNIKSEATKMKALGTAF